MARTKFKVGDKVWCFNLGWGVISGISDNINSTYPITVDYFKTNNRESYTINGELFANGRRCLFFDVVETPDAVLYAKKWRAKRGETYETIQMSKGQFITQRVFEEGSIVDDGRWENGAYFYTVAEAEEVAARLNTLLKNNS